MASRHVDNLIIGGGLVGSMTAFILAQQGYHGVLLEKNQDPGGVNGSFLDRLGNWFDYGRHVLHCDRSEFAANFFTTVQDGEVRKFALRRGITVCGYLIPYAATLEEWPDSLARNIKLNPKANPVRLGSTRQEFAQVYGSWMADLAFDEMLRAYPTLCWQREHGCPEERLMRWVFPWFFPKTSMEAPPDPAREAGVYSQESRDYHFRARHADKPVEEALYPEKNGFGNWVDAMLAKARSRIDVQIGVRDIRFDFDATSLGLRSVTTNGHRYTADRVFWCAPLPVLCGGLGWKLPQGQPQSELLGSFAFRDPVSTDYHEILFADVKHWIRRINLPELVAGNEASHTLQVEYTVPHAGYSFTEREWRERWLASLIELGLISQENEVLSFDFRRVSRGIVTNEDLGGFVAECRKRLDQARSNIVTPHLAIASDNNSRLVPEVFRRVYESLARC